MVYITLCILFLVSNSLNNMVCVIFVCVKISNYYVVIFEKTSGKDENRPHQTKFSWIKLNRVLWYQVGQ